MKKKEKISEALQNIDEEYIEKAANYQKRKSTLSIAKWGGLAASLAIVIAGTALIMPHLKQNVTPPLVTNEATTNANEFASDTTNNAVFTTIPETSTTSMWNSSTVVATGEMSAWEQYFARIQDETYGNYTPMVAFQAYEAPLGNKLTDVSVWGFWARSDKDFFEAEDFTGNEKIEYLRAEVYEIKDVSPDIAVLVRYLDKGDALTTTHYYTFVNKDVENVITSLDGFYERFNAESYFYVKPDYVLIEAHQNGNYKADYYNITRKNVQELRELLLSFDGRLVSDEELSDWSFTKQMSFDFGFASTGAYSAYAGIFDNGYLIFNIHSTNYFSFAFDIGKENAAALMAYIENNAELRHQSQTGENTSEMTTQTMETVETTYCEND